MKNKLIVLAFVLVIILPVSGFLGLCFAWYLNSYDAFVGAMQ